MADRLQIAARHRRILEDLLREHLPGVEVWAYGSRVNGRGHDGSDLDLVLRAPDLQELPAGQLLDFEDAIRASNIPFLVEARDWACLPEQFHQEIERDYVVMSDGAAPEPNGRGSVPRVRPVRRVPLRNLCEAIVDCLHSTPTWTPHGVVVLRSKNIRDGRLDLSQPSYTSEKDYAQRIKRATPRAGDLVITREAPMGEVCMIPEGLRCCLGQRMVLLRPSLVASDPRYLLYALLSEPVQQEIRSHDGTGSTVSNLRISLLEDLRIPGHALPEQRAIAHILGTLDDKIELNRRMNVTLEAMVRALFKSWFVDFDPVRAKMEGRDTGLPKEVADLFPDRLIDSELGEIPEDWEVSEIGTEVDAVGGATPSTKEPAYWDRGQHHWATPKDLSKLLSPVLLETERKITDAGAQKISSGLLPHGTVLLSSRAPIGYLAITEVPTAVNQGFIAMICRKRLPALYVLSWCHENLERMKDISGGSTFAEISKKAFRPLPVVVPANRVLRVYDQASRSLHDRVVSNTKESALLISLRDGLLPTLVSGALRVRDAEHLTGAVA